MDEQGRLWRSPQRSKNHVHTEPNYECLQQLYSQQPEAGHGLCLWAQALQERLTLCDPVGRSLPGSSVRGVLQAIILE